MLEIRLHNLVFFAHHGIHAEEKLLGNEFEINITIGYFPASLPVKHLSDSIDYVTVFNMVKTRMETPTALLETIATELVQDIFSRFPLAEKIAFSIRKKYPPIEQIQGSVGIHFELNRHER
ncbi:MAG: dihydroneopterin aldolase [Bacteroidota bacterium]|jgi:dihydroneopterin aldolase